MALNRVPRMVRLMSLAAIMTVAAVRAAGAGGLSFVEFDAAPMPPTNQALRDAQVIAVSSDGKNVYTATMLAEYGDPTTTATYVICVYDGSGNPQPLLSSAAAGGTCKKGKLCWQAKTTSYKYNDALLTPDGIQGVQLKEGLVNGKAKIQVEPRGINLPPPTLPLTLPVTGQVKDTDTGVCWEAVYTTADVNDGVKFKAKGD
jgi:hypothetical protein